MSLRMPVQAHSFEPLPDHRDWRQFCPDEWQMYSSLVRWITVPALATLALFLYSRVHRTRSGCAGAERPASRP